MISINYYYRMVHQDQIFKVLVCGGYYLKQGYNQARGIQDCGELSQFFVSLWRCKIFVQHIGTYWESSLIIPPAPLFSSLTFSSLHQSVALS